MSFAPCAPISVVIPTYNRRGLLEQALESVWAQTCAPAEVIVVDGASDDGTAEWLVSVGDRVTVVRTARTAPGAARNAGAAAATSDYVAFLDSDDLWLPWTVATFNAVLQRYGSPSYVSGSFRQFVDAAELAAEQQQPLEAESFAHYFSTWPRQFVIGAGMIAVRRDAFLGAGGFSALPINLEDHDLSLKLGLSPGFVQITRPLTLGWRQHAGGVTRDFRRSAAGCEFLITSERAGTYPGGEAWARVRRNIITMHARSLSIEHADAGDIDAASHIYGETFRWHLTLGRFRYLLTLPLLLLARMGRRRSA